MADASLVARFFAEFTPTTWSVIVLGVMALVALVKVWPLIKAKVNEARKIELDADADFRGDLLQRVKELEEAQHKDRLDFITALGDERKRCDEELDVIRARLKAAEDVNAGLLAQIRQDSQSTAALLDSKGVLGRKPATSKARRKDPK